MNEVTPSSLKDAPALIQAIFPVQKVSFEAQSERKAVAAQTLTGLGSYWKGRKPLILVRAIVLGSLLPPTGDIEKDLEIFEKLLAFDDHGLARRAFAQKGLAPKDIAARITLSNPWDYFSFAGQSKLPENDPLLNLECPFDAAEEGILLRWGRDLRDDAKLQLFEGTLATFPTYEEKVRFCKRPEEVNQNWLYAPVWPAVNEHYAQWGIKARSFPELVEQLGILRFGRRPSVGDTFSGGGSIPFEAARLGCDAYAADLNPIACMLTWGAMNIIGAPKKSRSMFEHAQKEVTKKVDQELIRLGVEHDEKGNRAKAYLYCLQTKCPETGWMVPMLPSRIISPKLGVIAKLRPEYENKCFEIEVVSNASKKDLKRAEKGTIENGALVCRVEDWRASFRVRWLFRRFRFGPQSGSLGRVSSPRSSNRACGFPAHGSRTRSCLHPRRAGRARCKASEAMLSPELLVPVSHMITGSHLVLATSPLEEPLDGVPVDRGVGRLDLAQDEVVRPSEHESVEPSDHNLLVQKPVAGLRQRANLAADAANARLAGPGADVAPLSVRAVVASNPVAEKVERLLRHPAASGLLGIDRQFQPVHQALERHQHVRRGRFAEHHDIIGIVDDLSLEALGMAQRLPAQYKPAHVDVTEQRGDR